MDIFSSTVDHLLSLLSEESTILASPEDALYFRSLAKQKTMTPSIKKEVLKYEEIAVPSLEKLDHPIIQNRQLETKQNLEKPEIKERPIREEKKETTSNPGVLSALEPKQSLKWRSDSKIPIEPLISNQLLKKLFQKHLPQIPIIDEIPSDSTAKKIANRWKTKNQTAPISILSFSEPPKQKQILIEITKAIDVYFGPAKIIDAASIEKENEWETFLANEDLKLIIACDYTLWQLKDLMKNYREIPREQKRTLGQVPLFLLPDLSLYLKDPSLKRSLWKAICNKLSS
jgi:hypothetical protein